MKESYPSPVSGSVVAAAPSSPSDAIFQINENTEVSRDSVGASTSGLRRVSAQQRRRRLTCELHSQQQQQQ